MKKTVRIIITFLAIGLITAISSSQIFAETIFLTDGFYYTLLNDNNCSICDCEQGLNDLVIPQKLDGKKVKEIAGWAFRSREDINSVDFGEADYLDTIGTMAFKGSGISGELSVPPTIKSLGMGVFEDCNCIDTLQYYSNVSIPEQGFYSCSSLENVVLSDGVTKIGRLAFGNCPSLNSVRIPESVTEIDETAFNDSDNVVIKCYHGSYAETFALENNIACSYINPMWGDANDDGKVNIRDVTTIQYYKIGKMDLTNYGQMCADVNHDGSISIRDVTLIQMKIAKMAVDDDCF